MRNDTRTSGYMLIELMIVLAILFILVVVVVRQMTHSGDTEHQVESGNYTRQAAWNWAKNLPEGSVRGVDCMQGDADGDGYIPCTVFLKEGAPIALECAASWSGSEGCRLQSHGMR